MEINVNGQRHLISFTPQKLRTLLRDYDVDFHNLATTGSLPKLPAPESMCVVGDVLHVISGGTFDPEDDANFGYIARGEGLTDVIKCFTSQWNDGKKPLVKTGKKQASQVKKNQSKQV